MLSRLEEGTKGGPGRRSDEAGTHRKTPICGLASSPVLVTDLTQQGVYGAAMGFLATMMDVGQMLGPIINAHVLASVGYTGSF